MKRWTGATLAEVIFAAALVAVALIPIFGIIPTSYMCIKKAEDFAAASNYAVELIEDVRTYFPLYQPMGGSLPDHVIYDNFIMNDTGYKVIRWIYGVDPSYPHKVVDVKIILLWKKIPERLVMTTRIYQK